MAVLSEGDRLSIFAEFMRQVANINNGASGLTKAQLRAAVDATDDWADQNAAAFNSALPQPARGALSSKQKAALYMVVVAQRWLVS